MGHPLPSTSNCHSEFLSKPWVEPLPLKWRHSCDQNAHSSLNYFLTQPRLPRPSCYKCVRIHLRVPATGTGAGLRRTLPSQPPRGSCSLGTVAENKLCEAPRLLEVAVWGVWWGRERQHTINKQTRGRGEGTRRVGSGAILDGSGGQAQLFSPLPSCATQ